MEIEKHHYRKEDVKCPHCDYVINDTEDMLSIGGYRDENMEDGAQWEADCPDCSKKIFVETNVTYDYSTYQTDDYL